VFERFTESARRTLFFARYEASTVGGTAIETEHLLLGLLRETKGITAQIFATIPDGDQQIRRSIEGRIATREKGGTSVEIPFSEPAKRVLQYAGEEADRLLHSYIGTEHLLLGLLREPEGIAAAALEATPLRVDNVRDAVRQILSRPLPPPSDDDNAPDVIERISVLVEHLGRIEADAWTRSQLVESIQQELERLRNRLGPDQAR
jgi:ATP-dependent Clp protease ATP-binding subunit ClpC